MYSELTQSQDRWFRFRMDWKRRRLRVRAIAKARELRARKRGRWDRDAILLFCTIRNEADRIDWFLKHYREIGVDHFCFVDNGSDDGTLDTLMRQPDVSLWTTQASYRASRFGLDWLNWLMLAHARGHWCVVADADELLIYAHWQTRPLRALTDWLDRQGQPIMPAMMLELYPKGPLDSVHVPRGTNPVAALEWFDPGNYTIARKPLLDCLLIQGGPRARAFFTDQPNRAPTLTKLPLVKWNFHNVWVNSTHSILPRKLNAVYARGAGEGISGALLHTKFLPQIVDRAPIEKARAEHFGNAPVFDTYYDAVAQAPDLWCEHSVRFTGYDQLQELGLVSHGGWA